MKRRATHIGRLRIRAADILSVGLGFHVEPSDIQPATGSYRTNWRLDVYRWELFTFNERGIPVIYGCWDTLTEFVRVSDKDGFHVNSDREICLGSR